MRKTMTTSEKDYQQQVHKLWERFIRGEEADYSLLRPEIYESWQRSRHAEIDHEKISTSVLDPEDLNIRINANLRILEIVHPYLEQIYSVVKGQGFFIEYCDKDGYILDLIGDPDTQEDIKQQSMLVIGANRKESLVGTNAIGTCLRLQKPIQIRGEEHYLRPHKHYACSSAPIFYQDGSVRGCINATGKAADVHPHTLGMIMCAAGGIEKELSILEKNRAIKLVSAQRNSIIQSISDGIILLNQRGQVIQINALALKMLHMKYEAILGKNLFDTLSFDGRKSAADNMALLSRFPSGSEIDITHRGTNSAPMTFHLSANSVEDNDKNNSGMVLCLYEKKTLNRMVNTISGYRAKYTFDSIIGQAPATKKMIDLCVRAGRSNSNILITGESGTGKELVAHAMHNASSHRRGPFVAVNCAALPKSLVESELFGYAKGAFTGASKAGNPGKFELADGGTIFLDEIGDMPLEVQSALLRVIETKEVVRIGSKHPKRIDVRIIAATNRNLPQAVEEKLFRKDLYYRLNVMAIEVPSLTERKEDIPLLADYFAETYSGGQQITVAPEVYDCLCRYHWPGNIRQLENTMERAINLTDDGCITLAQLPDEIRCAAGEQIPPLAKELTNRPAAAKETSSEAHAFPDTRDGICAALEESGGNVTKAGTLLGMSRRTVYRRLKALSIDYEAFRKGANTSQN